MDSIKGEDGYNLIEILVIASVLSLIIIIGASSITGEFAMRRSVDDVTNKISSTLQLTKLKSSRQGVEYRTTFAECTQLDETNPNCPVCNNYQPYTAGDGELTILTERGDSNRNSNTWCIETSQTKRFQSDLTLTSTIVTNPWRYSFNPNGSLGGSSGTIQIEPASIDDPKKCGRIVVNPFGRISVIQGNWDGTDCNAIRDPAS